MRILLASLDTRDRCPRLARLEPFLVGHEVDLMFDGAPAHWVRRKESGFDAIQRCFASWIGWPSRKPLFHPVGAEPAFEYDRVVCFDLLLLPDLLELVEPSKIVVDAREYYPAQFGDRIKWRVTWGRWHHSVCRELLPKVGGIVTVSQGVAELYAQRYGVRPKVLCSFPDASKVEPHRTGKPIRLVHHGNTNRNRNLEVMISAVASLGNEYSLDLLLVPTDRDYLEYLRKKAQTHANVKILEPVDRGDLVNVLAGYDIGLFVPRLVTPNLEHALPNKLFEFIQARLMIIATKGSDAGDLVIEKKVGEVCDATAKSLARVLANLTCVKIDQYKAAAHKCASTMTSNRYGEDYRLILEERQKGKVMRRGS